MKSFRFVIPIVLALLGCRPSAQRTSAANRPPFADLALAQPAQFDSNDPYRGFAYASQMHFGFGGFATLPPQFLACHSAVVDTLRFQLLTLELRADSVRGFLQDSSEGNAEAPVAMMSLKYDSIARVLVFDVPTAPRTLLSFFLSPSCESLDGVYLIKTAYHPQDGTSGVSAVAQTFLRAKH
jgi:hypothetical protein